MIFMGNNVIRCSSIPRRGFPVPRKDHTVGNRCPDNIDVSDGLPAGHFPLHNRCAVQLLGRAGPLPDGLETTDEIWNDGIDTNFKGASLNCKAVAPCSVCTRRKRRFTRGIPRRYCLKCSSWMSIMTRKAILH